MINGVKIVKLNYSYKKELLNLFSRAFTGHHPLVPSLAFKPNATRKTMKAFLTFFGTNKDSFIYGVIKDEKLLCGAVSIYSTYTPSFWALIRFIFSLSRVLGWRSAKELEILHKEEPRYDSPFIELVILGTLPGWQKKGLGRKMLQFLYNKAKKEKLNGIVLVADQDTPAFNFYLKESFLIDKKLRVNRRTLCWMRLPLWNQIN